MVNDTPIHSSWNAIQSFMSQRSEGYRHYARHPDKVDQSHVPVISPWHECIQLLKRL